MIKKGDDMTLTPTSVPKAIEKKILTAIELKKELDKYEREIKEELKQAMIDHNIISIKASSYTVTLATRTSYKPSGEFSDEFSKKTLDTQKVAIYAKLHGETPNGIEKSETQFITWRAK